MASNQETNNQQSEQDKRLLAMGKMAACLAHEIRNPLGSMEIFCSLLRRDLLSIQLDDRSKSSLDLLDQIQNGIKRVERIIENSLQFARDLKASRQLIDDPQGYLQSIVSEMNQGAKNKQVMISLTHQGESGVYADPWLMQQLIINLLSNAIDATVEANQKANRLLSGNRQVRISSDSQSKEVWKIEVLDEGVGMNEEVQSQLFDPFFTRKARGTGLGMSIVHGIVRAHQGRISVDSKEGEFTNVKVSIPRAGMEETAHE